MPGTVLQRFGFVRTQLDAAADLLILPSPEALDRTASILESAAKEIAGCKARLADVRGDAGVLVEARQVRAAFLHVRRLMENAARFHATWLSIRGAMTGGYTERGEAAPLRQIGHVCIEA